MLNRMARPLLSVLGIACLSSLLLSLTSRPVPAQFAPPVVPVRVTNTPLPVTGTVTANVNGTPSVNANITNAPLAITGGVNVTNSSVPISGSVTASVFNDQTSPIFIRDVDGRRAFQTTLFIDNTAPGTGVSCINSTQCQAVFDVPPGPGPTAERLVVEQISAWIQGATGQKYLLSFDCATNDTDELFFPYLELTFQGTFLSGTVDDFTANQPTRAYCDETVPPPFFTITNNAGLAFRAQVSVSGYEIIAP